MTLPNSMTQAQERKLYRRSVQASLQEFYGKTEAESKRLVQSWWGRLSATRAFESGLFLHAEPMNTAAGIAEVRAVAITAKNRERYQRILCGDSASDAAGIGTKAADAKDGPKVAARRKLANTRSRETVKMLAANTRNQVRDRSQQALAKAVCQE